MIITNMFDQLKQNVSYVSKNKINYMYKLFKRIKSFKLDYNHTSKSAKSIFWIYYELVIKK